MAFTLPKFFAAALLLPACAGSPSEADLKQMHEQMHEQVRQTETAFAATMADRDFSGFQSFLADEATFLSAGHTLRGKQQVADAWEPLFDGETAPFSWQPERVEVLQSGDLALSTGPIHDPNGKRVASFTSIWRRNTDGTWQIVFDFGSE